MNDLKEAKAKPTLKGKNKGARKKGRSKLQNPPYQATLCLHGTFTKRSIRTGLFQWHSSDLPGEQTCREVSIDPHCSWWLGQSGRDGQKTWRGDFILYPQTDENGRLTHEGIRVKSCQTFNEGEGKGLNPNEAAFAGLLDGFEPSDGGYFVRVKVCPISKTMDPFVIRAFVLDALGITPEQIEEASRETKHIKLRTVFSPEDTTFSVVGYESSPAPRRMGKGKPKRKKKAVKAQRKRPTNYKKGPSLGSF